MDVVSGNIVLGILFGRKVTGMIKIIGQNRVPAYEEAADVALDDDVIEVHTYTTHARIILIISRGLEKYNGGFDIVCQFCAPCQ